MRIDANLGVDPLSWHARTLLVTLTDATTGIPVKGTVEVLAGGGRVTKASPTGTGSFRADVPDADRIQLLVLTRDRVAALALERR